MLARNVIRPRNALMRRFLGVVRNQSSEAKEAVFVHPVTKVGNQLNEQLKSGTGQSSEIFSTLKDELSKLTQEMKDPTFLQRSFGLNGPLTSFLRKTAGEKGAVVDPFQVLNTLCQFNVARSPHFEIVLRYLLVNGSAQDVIALWVKYLETIAENPNAMVQSFRNRNGNNNSHENNIGLTSLAYLSLPGNEPDLNVLYQILQLDKDAGQQIPFSKIEYLCKEIYGKKSDNKKIIEENLDKVLYQYISTDQQSYLKKLDNTLQPYHLQDLYGKYQAIVTKSEGGEFSDKANPEILAKFMDRFLFFNRPSQAIKVFNDSKALDSAILKNKLLLAVANLPSHSKQLRLDRILAIWNSVIKPSKPNAFSYASLIEALGASGNIAQLQIIWTKEVPSEYKKDNELIEAYLFSVLRYNDKVTFESVEGKLPEKIQSIDLINAILLKMLKGGVSAEKFDSFYTLQFDKVKNEDGELEANRRPNIETLAIKMWGNYCHSKDLNNFEFLKSISQSQKNLLKVNSLVEQFVRLVPTITPIRELYKQVKEPLDTRKYGNFITAEFKKPDGSYEFAEKIFREFLENSQAQTKKIDRFLIEPLIDGFCEHSIRHHDESFLLKVSTYVAFASKVGSAVSYVATAKILHTIAQLSKDNNGVFGKSELEFINSFLKSVETTESFNPNPRDMELLRKSTVTIPEGLL